MRVVLARYHDRGNINTRLPDSLNRRQGCLPPLGLAYIAATLLKNGIDVKILDAQALGYSSSDTAAYFKKEKPEITGITCMTTNFRGALECAGIAKQAGSVTVLGGPQMDIFPGEMLSYDSVDYGISGEGEHAFLSFVNNILSNNLSFVPGLIRRENGKLIKNAPEIIENPDDLPFPARNLLPNERYSSIIGLNPVTTMITTRGCPFRCGFCFKGPSDRKFRLRSAANVADEMEQVIRDFGVREIMFYDDVMTLRREHIESICAEIIRRKIKVFWESPTRIDLVDRKLLKLMKSAGCIRLRYGVESGDETILEKMNKKISLEKIREVFRMTEEEGIERFAYFIIGYPGENEKTMEKSISLARSLNPDLVMFTLATPLPETPLFDEAFKSGKIDRDYWKDFTLGIREDRLPPLVAGAEEYVKKAYRKFYLRPLYVLKKISKIRNIDMIKRYFDAFMGIVKFRMSPDEK